MVDVRYLNEDYFKWMCHLITSNDRYFNSKSYNYLLSHLHEKEFIYLIEMDKNRLKDGLDLRYQFGYSFNIDNDIIRQYVDIRPCSVLEMMIALSVRCEDTIMMDPEYGDRTGFWFWNMLCSLGLEHMTDENYDSKYVDIVIEKFLYRDYEYNGHGGLFTIDNPHCDLKDVEIWNQMTWFLSKNF